MDMKNLINRGTVALAVALPVLSISMDAGASSVEWGISSIVYKQAGYDGSDWLFVVGCPYLNIKADVIGTALRLTAEPDSNLANANTFALANSGDVVSREYMANKGEYFAWARYGNETVRSDYQIFIDADRHTYLAFAAEYASYDTIRYGWLELGLDDDGMLKVYASAWDVNGNALVVGLVPEPAFGILICIGFSVLALRRRSS